MKITIASGKGGTGKTFISINLAYTYSKMKKQVAYLDCDVEEPNGHLFLKLEKEEKEEIMLESPMGIDNEKCTGCGKCAEACTYNAIAVMNDRAVFFPELCHICGACTLVCLEKAIIEGEKKIGELIYGKSEDIEVYYALLERGEGGMSPRLIQRVKKYANSQLNILDSPPGTACSTVESVTGSDLVILVADPTPFGINDLKLSVEMCRTLGIEPVIIVNRAEYRDGSLKEYCEEAELDIIGEIPDDREVAEVYSKGNLVAAELPRYQEIFEKIAAEIEKLASEERKVRGNISSVHEKEMEVEKSVNSRPEGGGDKPDELVIISGKGGTGKTSLVASFAALAEDTILSDCDVDAADLHLILQPEVKESGYFSGGVEAEIISGKCSECGKCYEACRFNAIDKFVDGNHQSYEIDPFACEGCNVCALVCPNNAVNVEDAINGEWYISETRFGYLTHAKLGMAEENSGRLVSLTRNKTELVAAENDLHKVIVDGSPGTGCPVIASLTGSQYALVVTEPTVSGIHDLGRVLEVTEHFGIEAGVVINKSDINSEMAGKIVKKIQEAKNTDFLGNIPYDDKVTEAQMEQQSVVEYAPECKVSQSIKEIFEQVVTGS